jgi:hypothetical protein
METISTEKGLISVVDDSNLLILDGSSFLEVIYSASSPILAFRKENFPPSFFDLKSGLAGDILQKVSNYRIKLIILGDFENITSKSLRDFIFESNRTGRVIFTDEMANAVKLLK